MTRLRLLRRAGWMAPLLAAAELMLPAQSPPPTQQADLEVQLGEASYDNLRDNGEVIASSPLYGYLNPIATSIGRAAQPRYEHPFKFILVHEKQANAFSTPGGNVYVTDSLMYFVHNREELAGTLCHEVSHTIHHDGLNRAREIMRIRFAQVGAVFLLDPSLAQLVAIQMLGDLRSNRFSRAQESAADATGAEICAAAGSNPYGLVWLFHDFEAADPNAGPEILSDHPSEQARIAALQAEFRREPNVFGRFNPDSRTATPLSVPKGAPIVLVQPSGKG